MPSEEYNKQEMRDLGIIDHVRNPQVEVLNGLVEIAAYLDWSIGKLRKYIKRYGFPAASLGSGREYTSTKTLINAWIRETHFKQAVKHGWAA